MTRSLAWISLALITQVACTKDLAVGSWNASSYTTNGETSTFPRIIIEDTLDDGAILEVAIVYSLNLRTNGNCSAAWFTDVEVNGISAPGLNSSNSYTDIATRIETGTWHILFPDFDDFDYTCVGEEDVLTCNGTINNEEGILVWTREPEWGPP